LLAEKELFMKWLRAAWVVTLCLFAVSFGLGSLSHAADQKQTTAKGAPEAGAADKGAGAASIATVNGVAITQSDLDRDMGRYERQMAMLGQAPDPAQVGEMKKKVLDGLIGREVLKQESQKLGIKVSDTEVDERVASLKNRFPSEKDFADTLAKMSLTEPELKTQFAQEMGISKLIDQEVGSKVTVTDAEAKAFYDANPNLFKTPEMVRASHILVMVDQKAGDAEKAKAKEKISGIQKRVQGGEDFASLAKEFSDCKSSTSGGDLDFFQRGQMVGPFEDAAFKLNSGEVSDIVETQFGYHLIKVTDKKPAETKTYDQVKDELGKYLKQQKISQQLTQYIDQLKSKDKIEILAK
jgi:peptidyl-prolyl cis-trans isomerase C